jgi:serine/threonine protein kinase
VGEVCRECGFDPAVPVRPSARLVAGTELLQRYMIGRLLGQGGFGITYLGWDDRLQIKVAIKEYFPVSLVSRAPGGKGVVPFTSEHEEGFVTGITKFLDEARLLARLREVKEIVGVQDFFEDNGTAYLVMELLEGRTLKKLISENGGRIEFRRALTLLLPIMRALHEIHAHGLVHRDVSPDNIFVTASNECKLLDFGAARQAVGEVTGALTVILKPGYAPPEQYSQDSRQGPWTDVYAMAATLYCAITGKPPPDITKRFQNDMIVRPSDSGLGTPPAFDDALIAALSLRSQERPQTMKDLFSTLARTMGSG